MLSMPPATTIRKSSQRRSLAAIIVARIPEPHTLPTVRAPVESGQPAASALAIAGATGCSSDDSSSDPAVDRSSPSTPEAVSSLTASTRPVGTSATTDATTSEPSLPTTTTSPRPVPFDDLEIAVFPVPTGSRPHDVAPAADGGVWYTAQRAGALGHLDPVSGRTRHIALGAGSAPHGVIVDDEG